MDQASDSPEQNAVKPVQGRSLAAARGTLRAALVRLGSGLTAFLERLDLSTTRTALHVSVWIAAGAVGLAAVAYAKLVAALQDLFFYWFHSDSVSLTIAEPLLFVLATWVVYRFGPDAKGSGIPQVLVATEHAQHMDDGDSRWVQSMVSVRTAIVKVLSSCIGILGGASIGREGPTVQIAAAGYAWFGRFLRKYTPHIEFNTFITAGAAAGVAAAFNAPIAGVTFAIEELGGNVLGIFRQIVMLSIIVAGIVAQGVAGNYLYFGRPRVLTEFTGTVVIEAIALGLAGGLLGGLFTLVLTKSISGWLPKPWWARALLTGVLCAAINYWTHGDTAGSGYEVTRRVLEGTTLQGVDPLLPLYKLATTTLSYLSGMAGGIFSPSLAIGAGVGLTLAKLVHLANFRTCALLGMVGYFSGVVRAPLTAVIIVMEMTDERVLVIPFMIAAFVASSVARRVSAEPLYHALAKNYDSA